MKDNIPFEEKIKTTIAGQEISWYDYQRYMKLATPETLRTLIKVEKTEEYARQLGGQMSPETKRAIIWVTVIGAIAGVALYVMYMMGLFEGGAVV